MKYVLMMHIPKAGYEDVYKRQLPDGGERLI